MVKNIGIEPKNANHSSSCHQETHFKRLVRAEDSLETETRFKEKEERWKTVRKKEKIGERKKRKKQIGEDSRNLEKIGESDLK